MKFAKAVLLLVVFKCAAAQWLDAAAAQSNAIQTTWKASVSPRFQNLSRLDIISMMGVPMLEHATSLTSLPKDDAVHLASAVPAAFEVYDQWPQCSTSIADQGSSHSA